MNKKPIKRISEKGKLKKEEKKKLLEEDIKFYEEVWEEREHYCYECGIGISNGGSVNIHHILPKSKYPNLRHNKDNVVIVCWQCHSKIETMLEKAPKVHELTKEKLLEYFKYDKEGDN